MRIALQLTESFIADICQMVGVENHDIFDDSPYAIITLVTPTEINLKLVSEDEIFEAVKTDSQMQVVSL